MLIERKLCIHEFVLEKLESHDARLAQCGLPRAIASSCTMLSVLRMRTQSCLQEFAVFVTHARLWKDTVKEMLQNLGAKIHDMGIVQ